MPAAATVGSTAHRVVDRVHRDPTHRRALASPAVGARPADRAQAVLLVAHLADGGAAVDVHLANLARAQAQLRVDAFAREELHAGAGRARHLRTLARLHLDAVDRRADRDVAQRQRVARLDRRLAAGHELRAFGDAARRDDVAALAVRIEQQRQGRAAGRSVLEPLHQRLHAVLVAPEIDDAIVLLVAAAL